MAGTGELSRGLDARTALATAMSNTQLLQTLRPLTVQLARLMNSSPALTHQLQLMDPATIMHGGTGCRNACNQQTALWETLPEALQPRIPYHIRHQPMAGAGSKIADLRASWALAAERREALKISVTAESTADGPPVWGLEKTRRPAPYTDRYCAPDYGQVGASWISFTADAPPWLVISIGDLDPHQRDLTSPDEQQYRNHDRWTEATQNIHEKSRFTMPAATVA